MKDVTFYHQDVLGSVVMLTGHNGQMVERYEYDAYGAAYNGKFDHGLAGMGGNPYGFTGKRYESEMGIYSFAFRDYNPQSMRWMTEDPVKDGLNWYQYCGSDPVNFVDPLGLVCGEVVADPSSAEAIIEGIKVAAAIAAGEPSFIGEIAVGVGVVTALANEDVREMLRENLTELAQDFKEGAINLVNKISNKNPFTGESGSTSETYDKKGNLKQKRTYGEDNYPEEDIDYDHDHGQGKPHKHKWSRPEDGGPPTHENRGPGQPIE